MQWFFFDILLILITLTCYFRCHRAGSQLKSRIAKTSRSASQYIILPGITQEERRTRKKVNQVTTGFNLAIWITEVFASILLLTGLGSLVGI